MRFHQAISNGFAGRAAAAAGVKRNSRVRAAPTQGICAPSVAFWTVMRTSLNARSRAMPGMPMARASAGA